MSSDSKYDSFECDHHPGYSRIQTCKNGIESEFTLFVPRQDPVELWRIRLKNTSEQPRTISYFPFQELKLASYGSGPTDVFTYTRGDYDSETEVLSAWNNNSISLLKYGVFSAADYPVTGYDCRWESFIGPDGRMEMPEAVSNGGCTNSRVSAERFCSVISGEVTLQPGEECVVHMLFGVAQKHSEIPELKARYLKQGAPEKEFNKVLNYWEDHFRTLKAETPARSINVLANIWFKHGAVITSRFVRGSGIGYRDIVQDIMGICPLDPEWTKQCLLEALSYMDSDGIPIRGYDPIAGLHDMRKHRDCGLWLPMTLSTFLRETGELEILNEIVPFRDQGEGSVWEHIIRTIKRIASERGNHELCLIGDGDWNDSLDEINLNGQGESAWLTAACVHAARTAAEIAEWSGREDDKKELNNIADELSDAVNANAWDGEWYVYGFAGDGRPIGSSNDTAGRIHLNMQTWAIISGIAPPDRQEKIFHLIDTELDTAYGPVLMHPAYTEYQKGIGKVSAKNPGHAENGTIYGHGIAFKMLADLDAGRGDKAYETYLKYSPFNPDMDQKQYRGEPFAAQRYRVGPAEPDQFGAGWYPYFTATPSWMLMLIFERMLGFKPQMDGLIIDPVIPSEWNDFKIERVWRGASYKIEVHNPEHVERGVVKLELDGTLIKGNKLPLPESGKTYNVQCFMG